jgi:hypothetical protein
MTSLRSIALASTLLLAGCFALTDFDDYETTRRETFTLPFSTTGEVPTFDILFVVDRPMPATLGGWDGLLPDFAAGSDFLATGLAGVVAPGEDGMYNGRGPMILHLGVVTSNLGAAGRPVSGCEAESDEGALRTEVSTSLSCPALDDERPYLEVIDGVVQNLGSITDVGEAVQCLVMAQIERQQECTVRQPLAALSAAIGDQRDAANAGFLRDQAGLAVVFVSDQDDCSSPDGALFDVTGSLVTPFRCFEHGLVCDADPGDPSRYVTCRDRTAVEGGLLLPTHAIYDQLVGIKDPTQVVISVLAGPFDRDHPARIIGSPEQPELEPTCVDASRSLAGLPGIRLNALRERFATNGLFAPICQPQYGDLYEQVAITLAGQVSFRCLPRAVADDDPARAGLQPRCEVWDVTYPAGAEPVRVGPYRSCAEVAEGVTCWNVVEDEICLTRQKMELVRFEPASAGAEVQAECWVELD